jgi:hypothetical protein
MVQKLLDPRRLNPLLALLVIAVVIAHAAGVVAPSDEQTGGRTGATPRVVSATSPTALAQIAEAQRLVRELRAHLVAAVTANDADASRRNLEQASAAVAASERVVHQLNALENAPRDSLIAQLTLTQGRLAIDGVSPVVAAVKGGNIDAARKMFLERTLARLAAHEDVLQAAFGQHHERMAAGYQRAQTAAERTYFAALLACLAVLAVGIAYVLHVRRRIIEPVELLGHVMRVVSEDHNYTHRAPACGHPAVVHMAGAFDRMMAGIQASFERATRVASGTAVVERDVITIAGTVERNVGITEAPAVLPAQSSAGRCAAYSTRT